MKMEVLAEESTIARQAAARIAQEARAAPRPRPIPHRTQ
jgi:hypothetical protein